MRQEARLPEERAVVICDPKRFLDMWKLSGRRPEILGLQDNWTRDPKFEYANQGFSRGPEYPVPLAWVVFRWEFAPIRGLTSRFGGSRETFKAKPVLDFVDGITRTIWLLHNGALYFPVSCSRDEAPELQAAVGMEPSSSHA